LPPAAAIVLHFDIDVLAAAAMPAAYFPHPEVSPWRRRRLC
jgi:hypothetical protein